MKGEGGGLQWVYLDIKYCYCIIPCPPYVYLAVWNKEIPYTLHEV